MGGSPNGYHLSYNNTALPWCLLASKQTIQRLLGLTEFTECNVIDTNLIARIARASRGSWNLPENNIYERQAFEAQGVEFFLALSTNEVPDILKTNKFVAVISDMGRKEEPKEGYVVLDKLCSLGDTTPSVTMPAQTYRNTRNKQECMVPLDRPIALMNFSNWLWMP